MHSRTSLKSLWARFSACTVTTKAGTFSDITSGVHLVIESQTQGGGVTVKYGGFQIDIDYEEWSRLIADGLVVDVPQPN